MTDGRDKTALLVIDVQVGVVADAWRRDEVVATIGQLVADAREQQVPVIWVRHHAADLAEGSDEWQIVPELTPADGEPLVEKTYGDSFAETDLADHLERLGARRLVLCGAQSDFCVNATMYGALHRGYDVVLAEDAHTTSDARFDDPRLEADVELAAQDVVVDQNRRAYSTRLPGVTCGIVLAADAFLPEITGP